MRLFRNTSVFSALFTLVRQTEEGDATDSRPIQARALIAAGAVSQAVYDDVLEGFVSDPSIFAAAVSGIARASLPAATIESLLEIRSMKSLRKLAKGFDPGAIETDDPALRAFLDQAACLDPGATSRKDLDAVREVLDNVMGTGPDGRAWVMLVAGHLSLLRTDRKVRSFLYSPGRRSDA